MDRSTPTCLFEATVVTGLEQVAAEECKEKLGVSAKAERGRIRFELEIPAARNILELKCVDNLYVIVEDVDDVEWPPDKDESLLRIGSLCGGVDWKPGLEVWRMFSAYPHSVDDILSVPAQGDDVCKPGTDTSFPPRFRVTCNRTGKDHAFSSMEAASYFGGLINDTKRWIVKMKEFHIEVVLNITDTKVSVCLALTTRSLHRRNISHFGPTTLRSTIAHSMLRLCNLQPGDLVCDPLCGGASISLEGAMNCPGTFHLCGDNHDQAWNRAMNNIKHINKERNDRKQSQIPIDVVQWDVCYLPLRCESVDVFVSDLPFGKRCGSKSDNRVLYKRALLEMARCCKPSIGRAVLLTQDKRTLVNTLNQETISALWKKYRVYWVNVGGLQAAVYVLRRTNV